MRNRSEWVSSSDALKNVAEANCLGYLLTLTGVGREDAVCAPALTFSSGIILCAGL
jgi:hypothetical protein